MKKYLDIILFSLLFFFIFSYFQSRNVEKQELSGLSFQAQEDSYTIPASLSFSVKNYSSGAVVFDACKDFSILFSGSGITLPTSACVAKNIEASQEYIFNLSKHYELFTTPGEYIVKWKQGNQEFIDTIQIEYKGNIAKIFTSLFYAPVYNLMAFLISLFQNSLGWAIVAITIIVRIVLLFPQHKMMVSQRKLQAIQPKIKKLQEEYKGKQQELGLKLMELYKQEKVNPLGSCGFLLIQMPILLVLYNIISHITSLSNEFYLYDFLPEFHISQINPVFFGINLLSAGGITGILLGVGVAAIQFVQMKYSLSFTPKQTASGIVLEKKKGETEYQSFMPDQDMINKFMLYGMPAMVGIFTYSLIAGVGLYWGIGTFFMLLQQLFVNKIIKK